jgi:lipopolysaccharide export system protein LptA
MGGIGRGRLRLALAVLLAAPAAALAQDATQETGGFRADPQAPVEVSADNLAVDQTAGNATFSGGVIVTQGDLRLTAPEILVEYTRNPDGSLGSDVARITASGGVLMVTATEAAEAQTATYVPSRSEIVMDGDVLLTQGGNTLAGQRLIVDLVTGTGRVEGRVRSILQPGAAPQ